MLLNLNIPGRDGVPHPVYDLFACRFDGEMLIEDRLSIPLELAAVTLRGTYACLVAPYYSREVLYEARLSCGVGSHRGILLHDPYYTTLTMLFPIPAAPIPATLVCGQWQSGPLVLAERDSGPHGKLAMATLARYDRPYIREWIEYHRLLGVGHFYVYTNHAPEIAAELQPLVDTGLVTTIPWNYLYTVHPHGTFPWWPRDSHLYTQPPQQIHALRAFGHRWDWMALMDADEFLVHAQDASLSEILDNQTADVCSFPGKWFGTGGRADVPAGIVDGLTRCEAGCTSYPKTIVRPRAVQAALIHWCYGPGKTEILTGVRFNHYSSISDHHRRRGPAFDRLENNACENREAVELRSSREGSR